LPFTVPPPTARSSLSLHDALPISAGAVLAFVLAAFWTPVGWRSSDRGIDALAARVHAAGLPVMSTLVVYEAIGGFNKFYRLPAFNMKVMRELHRASAPIIAGTAARRIPPLAPAT